MAILLPAGRLRRSLMQKLYMPKAIRSATLQELQDHERHTAANVRLGGYDMDEFCPTSEIQLFHLELTSSDLVRIFLLWEQTFIPHTQNRSCKLVDITSSAEAMAMERRPGGEVNAVDLTVSSRMEPVLVTNDLNGGPLVTIDGNHRLTSHYARNGTIDGVKAFVGVHCKMLGWKFVPPHAKYTNK